MKKLLITTFVILFSLAMVSAQAQCVSYGSVNWGLESSYGINVPITFKPQINSEQDLQGKSVKLMLFQKDIFTGKYSQIDQKTNLNILNDNSISEVTFFGVDTKGKIKFKLEIVQDSISFESEEISIETSMEIDVVSSPQIQNTGGLILIPITIKEKGGGVISSPSVTATIKKGLNDYITITSVTSSQLTFKTDYIGWIQINIEADANGYAHTSKETTIQLISANAVPKIKVDGIDFEILDGGRISTGTKKLSVGVNVGGSLIKIDKIELYMQGPDGEFDQLIFSPNSDKTEWKTNYNFLSEDRPYTIGGNPSLGVIGTASSYSLNKEYPISATFITTGGGEYCDTHPDDPICKKGIPWWVWIIIGVVVLLIIGGIVIAVKRR